MAYEVRYAKSFEDDFLESLGYIVEELGSRSAAKNLKNRIEEIHRTLEMYPESFPAVEDAYLRVRGYRKAAAGNYLVLFRLAVRNAYYEDGAFNSPMEYGTSEGIVNVVHLFHTLQDWPSLF